ncbi:hypothetical protein ACVDG3_09250 [Meridianimarinicoccus sp. RP-17]|uniref:hypothetical protein n=1 Tax=Meridianimarinicoccus zhengii TaxID=2056810 RepID=UPI000DAE1798|nr:hypothetical protein [Phycocomes zhengii]
MENIVKPLVVAAALAGMAVTAQGAAFTPSFDVPNFPGTQFDVESDPAYNDYYAENFGITVVNAYLYKDSRDTFDGIGIASGPVARAGSTAAPREFGRINFLDTTDTVTIDYWALEPSVYAAYSPTGALVDSVSVPAEISTMTLDGGIIGYILFSAERSAFATISSLTYNYDGTTDGVNDDIVDAPVPLPAGFALLAPVLIGMGGLSYRARRRAA